MTVRRRDSRVVVIGGGTGTSVVGKGLRGRVERVSCVVSMFDNGGSTGILRDELGVAALGDLRQCLASLSPEPIHAELMQFRFKAGTLAGHSFGNLLLAALVQVTGDVTAAVQAAAGLLAIGDEVLPVTTDDAHLTAVLSGGGRIVGEIAIWERALPAGQFDLLLEPVPALNPSVARAVHEADLVVLAPGSLYTSLVPNLLVPGLAGALRATTAPKVMVVNLLNKKGHTDGFSASDHLGEVERFAGAGTIDHLLVNEATVPPQVLQRHGHAGDQVTIEAFGQNSPPRIIAGDFLDRNLTVIEDGLVQRTAIRHDPHSVAEAVLSLLA